VLPTLTCERSLAIAQALAHDEPGNTTYRSDLSVSFERLADLATEPGSTRKRESGC